MYYLLEITLLFYLLYSSKKVLSSTICRNIMGIMGFLVAATGSSLVLFISKKLMPRIFDNLFLQIVIAIVIAILVFLFIVNTFTRKCIPFLERKIETMKYLAHPSRLLEKGFNAILLLCFLLYMFVIFDVLVQLINLSPHRDQITQHSFLMRTFFLPLSHEIAEEKATTQNSEEFQEEIVLKVMKEQNKTADRTPIFMDRQEVVLKVMEVGHKFSQTLRHRFQKTRGFLAEKTGAKTVLEHMRLVKKLFQLSEEEKIWLVHTTPALRKLANNPSLLAIIEDENLMALIVEASEGSLTALYQLGEEPLIKSLFDDKELVETIKQIQLKALLQRVKSLRLT